MDVSRKRLAGLVGTSLTCLLVHLDSGLVSLNPDDFTDQFLVTDTDLKTMASTTFGEHGCRRPARTPQPTNSYMAHPVMPSATTTVVHGAN